MLKYKMITEYTNDIKQIMSDKNLREDLRHIIKTKIKEVKIALK